MRIDIAITKGRDEDVIAISREDGSKALTRFPKKGPIPHDAVHYFVERGLGLRNGFWGTVADGMHPEHIGALAKAAGHASASRAQVPDKSIVELIQAERLVECFEADFWGGGGSDVDLVAVAETGCVASFVPLPAIEAGSVSKIRSDLADFARFWTVAPLGHETVLRWD
jgi:hypothetical protein